MCEPSVSARARSTSIFSPSGSVVLADERLTLPHPRLLERAFALVPLAEIAPALTIGGVAIGPAAERLDRTGIERLEG